MAKKQATSPKGDRTPKAPKVRKEKSFREGDINLIGRHPVTGRRLFIMEHNEATNEWRLEQIYGARKDAEAYMRKIKPKNSKIYTEEKLRAIYEKESGMRLYIQDRCPQIEDRMDKLSGWISKDSDVLLSLDMIKKKSEDQQKHFDFLKRRIYKNQLEIGDLLNELNNLKNYIFANYQYLSEVLDGDLYEQREELRRVHNEILRTVC